MMAGAGGAMPATGWRATAIRFQQFGEGYAVLSLPNFRLPRSWTLSLSAAARRTTPAASAAGADFFLADCCSQIRGDDGARRVGPMLMSAVAGATRYGVAG